jgi:ribosomal protein RSM22 (predicted rRNA methylase)
LPRPKSRIHRGLVGARELVGQAYLADRELRREYDAEIAPRTFAALAWILDTVPLPRPGRVLDLGAGTGAAGRAIADRWPGVELVAVDQVAGPGIVQADVTHATFPRGVEGRFDLLVAAHLLGELSLEVDGRARLVADWCRELLADDGHCILIEPALRLTSRALLAVRDHLVASGFFVASPCLWQGPCPALVRERDFCHASAAPIAQGRSRVDFSYLVLARPGRPCGDTRLFRVVSDPMKDKGRLRLFVCGGIGRVLVTRLDRDRSPGNRAFDRLERGDLARIDNAVSRPDGLRCTGDTRVERV